MKTIGTTRDGGYIVEMSYEEHSALARLAAGQQGWVNLALGESHEMVSVPLESPLDKIHTFTHIANRTNDLYEAIKLVKEKLEG